MNPSIIDRMMVGIANIFNLLVMGVFISRAIGYKRVEWIFGIITVLLALPLGIGIIANITAKREWWTIILPFFLLCYCVLEFVLDYAMKSDFRNTGYLWIYLAVFYLGAIAMIGYSFGVSKTSGFITLATYFMGFIAAWYSYSQVGHG